MDNKETITRGLLGMLTSGGSTAISFFSQLEMWLRIGSLIVGITVGILTCVAIVRGMRK